MANSISSVTTGTGGIVLESVDTSGNTNIKSGTTTIVAVSSTGAAVTGTLSSTGNTTLGDASTDTLNVGNGDLIKNASGEFLIGLSSNISAGKVCLKYNGLTQHGFEIVDSANNNTSQFLAFFVTTNTSVGSITNNAGIGTLYNTTSDYRLKENISPMLNALDKIALLKPVTYSWKSNGYQGQGFIAHELQEIAPDCVSGKKDAVDINGKPIYQGIDTSFLVATLTAAIQEQQALITSLTARLDTQAEQIKALQGAK